MSYRIGDLSKLLNISVETIRFYESKKIVNPHRQDDNRYRVYDTWDVFYLMECILYKNFHLSLKEVAHQLNEGTVQSFLDKLDKTKLEIQNKIKLETLLIEKIEQFNNKYEMILFNLGKYWIRKIPESYLFYFLESSGDSYGDIDLSNPLTPQWIKHFPFVTAFQHCPIRTLYDHLNRIKWGLKIEKKYSEILKLPLNESVIIQPEQVCITTFIDVGEKGELSTHLMEPIVSYAERNGYKIGDDIFGEIMLRTHESGEYHRFIEVILPIRTEN